MPLKRVQTWLLLLFLVAGLVVMAVQGVFLYVRATATPLHPNPGEVPSVAQSVLAPRWDAAVERARQIARVSLAEQNLAGMSVAVGIDGEIAWAEGFGWADLEHQVKVSPGTRFRIGTASMALTSAAVGLLLDRGALTLDDEIQVYVPGFPRKEWPITLRHLMGHVAGVRNDGGDEGPLFSQQCDRPADALPHFADRALLFEPGTEYRRSSYGWILVSAAVEAAAGQRFLAFMREQIFEPLGMGATRADSTDPVPGLATSYFPRFAAEPRYGLDLMRDLNYSCYSGASVFLSTSPDLVRFAMAIDSGTFLGRDTVDQLQAPQRLRSRQETDYGLGWNLGHVTVAGTPTTLVGHDGMVLGGMAGSFMTFREHGVVVSVLSNTSYADTSAVAVAIGDVFARAHGRQRAPASGAGH